MNIEIVNGENYLSGAASLLGHLDKKIIVILRDGRHLVGILRSFDQFLNLVMQETCERIIIPGNAVFSLFFCFDVSTGLFCSSASLIWLSLNFVYVVPQENIVTFLLVYMLFEAIISCCLAN
jgi:small nuclear ribonucleoprotein (snRNP)-like protein